MNLSLSLTEADTSKDCQLCEALTKPDLLNQNQSLHFASTCLFHSPGLMHVGCILSPLMQATKLAWFIVISCHGQLRTIYKPFTQFVELNRIATSKQNRKHTTQYFKSSPEGKSRPSGVENGGSCEENSRDENRALVHQLSNESRLSITDSLSEFFDAQEVLLSPSSSENEISDDDSYVSDISDNLSLDNLSNDLDNERQTLDLSALTYSMSSPDGENTNGGEAKSRRRTCLPAPCPGSSNISLWNILRNNIGKDLSKVAMPVELNEPLNTLQRLCEELEYSELLDKAAQIPSPLERMVTNVGKQGKEQTCRFQEHSQSQVYVAAFAISAYASSYYRAGSKPFNPVLGETYECIREDKGFQFFSEQNKWFEGDLRLPLLESAVDVKAALCVCCSFSPCKISPDSQRTLFSAPAVVWGVAFGKNYQE
ncbi:hypothetical protein P7K49_025213 [Saguinus oedipus]|uniref:Uncharacterized protein n=1 Tax=Saguinus oedipus TaxID=9490 RepID=A0ABQ9UGG5_SAGOE|nr:hypothetical protein P7K49_025213 [Saguinus oedipus]